MMTSNVISFAQRREQFIDDFIVVYFSKEYLNIHLNDRLQNIVDTIHIYSNLDECIDFITTITSKRIFFICSNDCQYCIALIFQLSSIDSIYTFHSYSVSPPELNADRRAKFQGIFTDIDRLCERIQLQIRRSVHSFIGFQTMNAHSINKNKQDASFMYAQLLKEILLLPQSESKEAKLDLMEFCRQLYTNDTGQLQWIDEFETNPNNCSPIWFYTTPSFLHRLLNSALRVQEVGTLYKLRYFIKQIHEEIVQLHSLQHEDQQLSTMDGNKFDVKLYRGQAMMPEEFERLKLNIGGLLSISNFLSTSRKEDVGRFFAQTTLTDLNVISVCMIIRVKTILEQQSMNVSPFASIKEISCFGEAEDEVLLSMGSVFRIETITQSTEGIWLVNLTLTGDEDDQLCLVRESLKTRIDCDDPLLSLGKLMYTTGDYQKAIEFFEQLLHDDAFLSYLPNQSVLHNELAQIYKQIGDYLSRGCRISSNSRRN